MPIVLIFSVIGGNFLIYKSFSPIEKVLEDEVQTMDYYITGEVYGYQVIKRSLNQGQVVEEILDSCSGFYGDDFEKNGIADYVNTDTLIDKFIKIRFLTHFNLFHIYER